MIDLESVAFCNKTGAALLGSISTNKKRGLGFDCSAYFAMSITKMDFIHLLGILFVG